MDTTAKPSFIPKRPLSVASSAPRRGINPLSLIGFIIFFAALVLAAGVFVWKMSLEREIRDLQTSLEEAREVLDDQVIAELVALSARMQSAKTLLNNHRAVSAFFDFLEPLTLKNVRFKNFTFSSGTNQGNPGGQLGVSMDGEALNFATLALQSDVILANTQYLRQPSFTNVAVDRNGVVTFRFAAFINPEIVSYRERVMREETGDVLRPILPAATSTVATTTRSTATTTRATATTTRSTTSTSTPGN
jgi:hypothetical protein